MRKPLFITIVLSLLLVPIATLWAEAERQGDVYLPLIENSGPVGGKIAFTSFSVPEHDGSDISLVNADASGQTKLTNNPGHGRNPAWSPDGSTIAFVSGRGENRDIYIMDAGGPGQTILTNNPRSSDRGPVWSP